MLNIERYAYTSKLRTQAATEKLFLAVLTLGVCLWADSQVISLLVLLTMTGLTIWRGGIPGAVFFRALLIPLSFIVLAAITIAIEVRPAGAELWLGIQLFGKNIGLTQTGLLMSVNIFFRSLAAVSCLYYLSFNTPLVDLVMALKKLRCPQLMIEMMSLIYRFIFVLLETAETMYHAQDSRLGYSTLGAGYRSMASLVGTVFIRSYQQAERNYTALEARGYGGEINVLAETNPAKFSGFIMAAGLNAAFVLVNVLVNMR